MKKYFIFVIISIFIGCGGSSTTVDKTPSKVDKTPTKVDKTPTKVNKTPTVYPKVSSVVVNTSTINTDASIIITFDKSMNESTLTNTNITLKSSGSNEGTFSKNSATEVDFTGVNISSTKTFTLTVTTNVQDGDNTSLESVFTKTYYSDGEVIYGEVTSPYTSKVWLDRHLGAEQICTAANDSDCYGDFYQWGRSRDGHEKTNSSLYVTDVSTAKPYADDLEIDNSDDWYAKFITTDTDTNNTYDWTTTDSNGATRETNWLLTDGNSICPIGFRVPSKTEFNTELGITIDSGANIDDGDDAFATFLKLPMAADRDNNGVIDLQGTTGFVVTSTVNSGVTAYSWIFYFNTAGVGTTGTQRAIGHVVRCIKN